MKKKNLLIFSGIAAMTGIIIYFMKKNTGSNRIAYLRSAMATALEKGDNAKYVKYQDELIKLTNG